MSILRCMVRKPTQDRHYEENHTYSNLLPSRIPLANLLVLNFCYHNVHHQKPSQPWHRLPAWHDKCYPKKCPQLVPLSKQLAKFRRYRIERIHHTDSDKFIDADGVSFLVGV